MATPQYTIKTGADSSDYFSREVTISDKSKGYDVGDSSSSQLGLVKATDDNICDDYKYPVLVRRTGDSLKGTTESIESNELRKGRTKSAPRKGNSSSEGSLDFELSPETYDDILEAALRGEWKEWISDSKVKGRGDTEYGYSGSNLDKLTYADGFFETKIRDDGDMITDVPAQNSYRLLSAVTDDLTKSIIKVSNPANFEVHELTCGTQDIRYSVLKHFGGVKDDDLFQEFEHLSVNTMSLSVTPGQIITGSFGFMGSNNPEILQWGDEYTKATEFVAAVATANGYYTYDDSTKVYTVADPQPDASTFSAGTYYTHTPHGIVKQLDKRLLKGVGASAATRDTHEVMQWLNDLPQKGTSTDQYTAREGFLYINGERVRYGSNLTLELNNGLEKTFAIFEKDAIAMSPLTLDITGNLGAYLIKGYSEKLYQLAVQDKDVEMVFCFQDKEENPEALYVLQIFKAKFTDTDISSGAENLEVSFPYQSFEEKAMRVLRVRKRKPRAITFDATARTSISVSFTSTPSEAPTSATISATCKVDGVDLPVTFGSYASGVATLTFDEIELPDTGSKKVDFTVTYNGTTIAKTFSVDAE